MRVGSILNQDRGAHEKAALRCRMRFRRWSQRSKAEDAHRTNLKRSSYEELNDMSRIFISGSSGRLALHVELLEGRDMCACERTDLLLEIQEAVRAMTERIESLLQFSSSGRKCPLVHWIERLAPTSNVFMPSELIATRSKSRAPATQSTSRTQRGRRCT